MEDAREVGRVPEIRGGRGQTRLDIVAQSMRVAILLEAHGARRAVDRAQRDFLAQILIREMTPEGALPFAVSSVSVQLNVWTAMFAEQALALGEMRPAELSAFAAAPLIV
jgi:hypothetical protein